MKAIVKGNIVQIDPTSDDTFGGCLMVVTDIKPWGVKGYVTIPGKGDAYYRCNNEEFVIVGIAKWGDYDT